MKQLDQQRIVSDKHCSNMTSLELGPGSASNSVDMCVCKTSNCNLGPKEGPDYDDNMIGATMPATEISNDTTGLLINQDQIFKYMLNKTFKYSIINNNEEENTLALIFIFIFWPIICWQYIIMFTNHFNVMTFSF